MTAEKDRVTRPRVGPRDQNPRPDLFTTFERLETCHRVEVTEDNVHLLAQWFGCSVDYSGEVPVLRNPTNHPVQVGRWIDVNGSGWNPDPLSQDWSPEGTYVATGETP